MLSVLSGCGVSSASSAGTTTTTTAGTGVTGYTSLLRHCNGRLGDLKGLKGLDSSGKQGLISLISLFASLEMRQQFLDPGAITWLAGNTVAEHCNQLFVEVWVQKCDHLVCFVVIVVVNEVLPNSVVKLAPELVSTFAQPRIADGCNKLQSPPKHRVDFHAAQMHRCTDARMIGQCVICQMLYVWLCWLCWLLVSRFEIKKSQHDKQVGCYSPALHTARLGLDMFVAFAHQAAACIPGSAARPC